MRETELRQSEGADTAARMIGFLGELSEPLLPAAERADLLILFSLLSSLALNESANPRQRAALCSDGTPVEFSLALDDRGRHALRFVCDAGAPPAAWDGGEGEWFRNLADKVAPRFHGRAEILDRLFAAHLADAPETMPFKVWFGAGASPDSPLTGLVYFNSEWLATPDLIAILAPQVGNDAAAMYLHWAKSIGAGYAGVAYDFDPSGLRKVKLYLRLGAARVRNLEATLEHFPGGAGSRLSGLFDKALGAFPREQRGGTMLALGFSTPSGAVDASVYFHLESWGVPDFEALTPVVRRLLDGWGLGFESSLAQGPHGCAPTLLSLSTSGDSDRLAIYFRPRLAPRLAATMTPPAMAAT